MSGAAPRGRILCIGGATVDRSYRLEAPLRSGTSNPVTGRRGFGGVARNVAEGLARLGDNVALLTAIGDDESGRALMEALAKLPVDARAMLVLPGAATAEYVAVLTPGGDLALGLAEMTVFDQLTPEALRARAGTFHGCDWVFADCNLPAAALAALARRQIVGTAYRLAVDPVSVAKSARLPNRLDGIDLLVLNRDEAGAMLERCGLPPGQPEDEAAALCRMGAAAVVLTLGSNGALVAGARGMIHVAAVRATVFDVTGAGDTLIAASLFGLRQGRALADAVALGCRAAARTAASDAPVAPDLRCILDEDPH